MIKNTTVALWTTVAALMGDVSPASTLQKTLKESICGADAIVIGTLKNVQENSVRFVSRDSHPRNLDLATISVSKRFKAAHRVPRDVVSALLRPGRNFEKDVPGVWFLQWNEFFDMFFISGRDSSITAYQEAEIERIIKNEPCDFPPDDRVKAAIR